MINMLHQPLTISFSVSINKLRSSEEHIIWKQFSPNDVYMSIILYYFEVLSLESGSICFRLYSDSVHKTNAQKIIYNHSHNYFINIYLGSVFVFHSNDRHDFYWQSMQEHIQSIICLMSFFVLSLKWNMERTWVHV